MSNKISQFVKLNVNNTTILTEFRYNRLGFRLSMRVLETHF